MREILDRLDSIVGATQRLVEFDRMGGDGREFMSWPEFLAIFTPVMRQKRFSVDKDRYPSMLYSRQGRTPDEFFVIVVEPADDQVHYAFGSVNNALPDIEDEGLVRLDRPGAEQLGDKIDDHYGIT